MVPSLRRFTLILSSLAAVLGGTENYYVSFRVVTDRGLVSYDRLRLSKMMTQPAKKSEKLCEILCDVPDFRTLARIRRDTLLSCLARDRARIRGYQKSSNQILSQAKTILVVGPTPIQVEFNDGLAIIYKVE